MQKHELLHQGIKPFSCKICNASFTQQSNLKKHIETHSNINRTQLRKVFECQTCNKGYSTKTSLYKHMVKCTDEKKESVINSSSEEAYVNVCGSENSAGGEDQFLGEFGYVIRKYDNLST